MNTKTVNILLPVNRIIGKSSYGLTTAAIQVRLNMVQTSLTLDSTLVGLRRMDNVILCASRLPLSFSDRSANDTYIIVHSFIFV